MKELARRQKNSYELKFSYFELLDLDAKRSYNMEFITSLHFWAYPPWGYWLLGPRQLFFAMSLDHVKPPPVHHSTRIKA